MSIESIVGSAKSAVSLPSAEVNAEKIAVFEQDGQVMVESANESAHALADKHCYNCVTGFESLQSAARRGEDGGLFKLAVEQTKQRQKALGVAAQPGGGPLRGLTETGRIREAEEAGGVEAPPPKARESDSVSLSRSGMLRATGAEIASLTGSSVSTDPAQESDEAQSAGGGAVDAHGHPIDGVKAVEPPQGADADHGGEGRSDRLESDKKSKGQHVDKLEQELTDDEKRHVEQLQQRDTEVRAHEQAHKAAGGQHAGSISLSYETGPDGRKYAVAGEVPVDISKVAGDPRATLQKMQTIQRAALAPAEPSSADRQVASRAAQYANEARAELIVEEKEAPKKPGPGRKEESSDADEARKVDQSKSEGGARGEAVSKGEAPDEAVNEAESTDDANSDLGPLGLSDAQAGGDVAAASPTEGDGAAVNALGASSGQPGEASAAPGQSGRPVAGGAEGQPSPGAAQNVSAYGRGARAYQFVQPASFNATA